jgi:predicted nuclease of restriction endonuclease-like (RecB) superfamily
MTEETNTLTPTPRDDPYDALLADLRAIIASGRGRAAAAVNAEIVATYWRIGERILDEERRGKELIGSTYGERLLAQLGDTLSHEFGRAFGRRNLYFMRQFYLTYAKVNALRTQLTWTHYRSLMRLPDDQRAFYERVAAQGRWSSRELDKQIASMLYERAALSRQPAQLLADATAATSAEGSGALPAIADAFKDPYVLDFLGLEDTFSEKDLEMALIRNIERFLVELGTGFYFGGRQRRITIGDEDFYIDLVFWHRHLKSQVFIDLKIGAITPADIAQMRLYLNWAKRHDMQDGENDPIGLILCGSKNEQVVELLLADSASTTDQRIKVAQYLLLDSQDALKERLAHLARLSDEAHEGGARAAADADRAR